MNRRSMIKTTGTAAGFALLGGFTLGASKCGSTAQLSRWTGVLITSLKDVSPILADMGAGNIVTLIGRAIPIAEQLKNAFEDNDHADALTFLDNLINPDSGIIVEIANAVGALADEGRKRLVLGLLAIGMVALRLVSANIENEVPAPEAAAARAARPSAVRSVTRAAAADPLKKAFEAARF